MFHVFISISYSSYVASCVHFNIIFFHYCYVYPFQHHFIHGFQIPFIVFFASLPETTLLIFLMLVFVLLLIFFIMVLVNSISSVPSSSQFSSFSQRFLFFFKSAVGAYLSFIFRFSLAISALFFPRGQFLLLYISCSYCGTHFFKVLSRGGRAANSLHPTTCSL